MSRDHSRWFQFFVLAFALSALAPRHSVAAGCPGGGKNSRTDLPVTTAIEDLYFDGSSVDIASDGLGAYPNGLDGVSSLLLVNGYNCLFWGDWKFSTMGSVARSIGHEFESGDAVLPGDPHYIAPANPPYLGTQLLPTQLSVKCTLVNNNMFTMGVGDTFQCPFLNAFNTTPNVSYGLHPALSFTNFPETTDVEVVCNAVAAGDGFCNDWFIQPISLGEAVGRLTKTTVVNHKEKKTIEGDFYMRFHIHVTRP